MAIGVSGSPCVSEGFVIVTSVWSGCDNCLCSCIAISVSGSPYVSVGFVVVACVAAWLLGVSVEWG